MFPSTHTNELNEFLSSKTQILRAPVRRESLFRALEAAADPKKSNREGKIVSSTALGGEDNSNINVLECGEGMNITFYNAKSSCFPPISRVIN